MGTLPRTLIKWEILSGYLWGHYNASGYLSILYGYGDIHQYIPLFGRYGVGLFFAVSGFLMASIIEKQSPETFLIRRLIRIYPLLILVTVAFLLQPWISRHFDLASLTMVPLGQETAAPLGVEWTLVLEIGFYVVLYLISIAGMVRYLTPLTVIWLAVLAWNSLTHVEPALGKATILNFLLAPANIAFAIGLMLPRLIRLQGASSVMLVVGLITMVVAHFIPTGYLRPVVSVSAALLVGWAATKKSASLFLSAPLNHLGNISYPLYLVHVPIILLLYQYSADPITLFAGAIVLSLLASSFIEPVDAAIHEQGKKWVRGTSPILSKALALGFAVFYVGFGLYYL